MKQVLVRRGQIVTEDVPAPVLESGRVLVAVRRSCISAGTELSGIHAGGTPLWQRAIQQPGKVKQVVESVATQGLARTRSRIKGRLSAGEPTGYSAAGVVLQVGAGIDHLRPGDRVACAGAQFAHHAEVVSVPRNLVTLMPDGLTFEQASTVTLGAIALQGVRRAQPTLGETFVVIGLGILGQLTVQLLRANGCRVVGTDIDPARVAAARELGMDVGLDPASGVAAEAVVRTTDGIGADGVIVTAATSSDEVISTAFQMCRRKGRVVLVGDVGLDLDRADFYTKELDFLISTSYGPGRYDHNYEERGLDYPVGYVRWTENRNMGEYLRLVADGRVQLEPLTSRVYPVEAAHEAYAALEGATPRPLIVLLSYPDTDASAAARATAIPTTHAPAARPGMIGVALVGAGSFAKGMHLPNIQAMQADYQLRAVVSRSGHGAAAAASQFGANYATTDYERVLDDPDVDLVLIATRHDLHARMALEALRHGKHVLVEKPLAVNREELEEVAAFYRSREGAESPILVTGFNRRFSPHARRLLALVAGRTGPMILNYRMNAGHIPLTEWVHTAEGGGRNVGEACHIYDLFTFLTGSEVVGVSAQTIRPTTAYYSSQDNFVATIAFADGSLCTLTYTALGSREYPKEQLEVFVDGRVLVLDDYRNVTVAGARGDGLSTKVPDKGHAEELRTLAAAIRAGGPWPIPLWQQIQAMRTAFDVETFLTPSGR